MRLKNLDLTLIKVPETRVTAYYPDDTGAILRESLQCASLSPNRFTRPSTKGRAAQETTSDGYAEGLFVA